MNNSKWYRTASFKDSKLKSDIKIDRTVEFMDSEFFNIDICFYADNEELEWIKENLPSHILPLRENLSPEICEEMLMAFPGLQFESKIGHEIANIAVPFVDFELFSKERILNRVQRMIKFGKDINFIGHVRQNTIKTGTDINYSSPVFIQELPDWISGTGFTNSLPEIKIESDSFFEMGKPVIIKNTIDEILQNMKQHSSGGDTIVIDCDAKTIKFINNFKHKIPTEVPKACLRRPYMAFGAEKGPGLGIYKIAIASLYGGFKWDLNIENSTFSFCLVF